MAQTITVNDVYIELKKIEKQMVTKEQLERAMETVLILSNPETVKQIKESNADIKAGRVKEVRSVKDLL